MCQGARIGTNVLAEFLARGTDAGISEVYLHLERSNDAAIRLYENYRFDVETERAVEFEMRRPLGEG